MSCAGILGGFRTTKLLVKMYNKDDHIYTVILAGDVNRDVIHYRDGVIHRDDGPAIEHISCMKRNFNGDIISYAHHPNPKRMRYVEWYRNGALHRDGAPAIVSWDRVELWYCNGVFHRDDGPSMIKMDVPIQWSINDTRYQTEREYLDANPRWRAVTDAMCIGARDSASPFSLLDQVIIARIAYDCFR